MSAQKVDVLPAVARLYYSGSSNRRYKRASVRNGPGELLCFKSVAEEAIRRARVEERSALAELIEAARVYFDGYCQDEAGDDGVEFTGCSVEQHEAAKRLQAALARLGGDV